MLRITMEQAKILRKKYKNVYVILGGESIYGKFFRDESFGVSHDKEGILSMVNNGPNTNSSQFLITLAPTKW